MSMLLSREPLARGLGRIPHLFLAALILQAFFILHLYPPDVLVSGEPLTTDDYPYHYYDFYRASLSSMAEKVKAYDPSFSLGFVNPPLTLGHDIVLLSLVLFFVKPPIVFSLYLLAANLAVPLWVYNCSRNFGFGAKAASLSALVSVFAWQFAQEMHNMLYCGLFSFILGCHVAVYAASLYYSYAVGGGRKKALAFIGTALLCLCMHRLHFFTLVALILVISITIRRKVSLVVAAVSLLALGIGVIAVRKDFLWYAAYHYPPIFHQSEGLATLINDLLTQPVQTWIFITGLLGILQTRGERKRFIFGLLATLVFLIGGYFGSMSLFVSYFQPQRILIPALVLLTLFAGKALEGLFAPRRNSLSLIPILLFIIMLLTPSYGFASMMREEWGKQVSTLLPQDTRDLIGWIAANTSSQGRILVEDSGAETGHVIGGHSLAIFPLYTEREFAGRPLPYTRAKEGVIFPEFSEGKLFNRPADGFSEEELRRLLSLYNIEWVVSWSPEGLSALSSHPSLLAETARIGKFRVFHVNLTPSFFLDGGGVVRAGFNQVVLSNLTGERIVLKYEYDGALSSREGLPLEPVPIEGTLNTFIAFNRSGFSEVVLRA